MNFYMRIKFSETDKTVVFPEKHKLTGGTYVLGGTDLAWLSVAENYDTFFKSVLGEKGIRTICGKPLKEADAMLQDAIRKMDEAWHYEIGWNSVKSDAEMALRNLWAMGYLAMKMFPDCDMVWDAY